MLLDNALADAAAHCRRILRQNLGIKRRSLGAAARRAGGAHRPGAQDELARASRRWTTRSTRRSAPRPRRIKAHVRLDLEEFTARAARARCPTRSSAPTPTTCSATCSSSSRTPGRRGPSRRARRSPRELERLAEEIIQVTNENVPRRWPTRGRASSGRPRRRSSSRSTRSSTTSASSRSARSAPAIFLFVNTLVGGLLTLAAPILAIVLQGRSRRRDQGPGQGAGAPVAVDRAAARSAPSSTRSSTTSARGCPTSSPPRATRCPAASPRCSTARCRAQDRHRHARRHDRRGQAGRRDLEPAQD